MKIWEIILLTCVPTIVMAAVFYYVLHMFFKEENQKRNFRAQQQNRKEISPLRFQAYERVALFLERIKPTYIASSIAPKQSLKAYELALLKTIQTEYEHNLSQQIYVNPETWKIVYSAKNATQNFIRECSKNLAEDATAQDFQQEIIKRSVNENIPSNQAMLYLQKDIQGNP